MAEAGELKPHPDNAHRSHPEKQLDRYEAVISGNGWRKAVVVSKRSGFIVKGHGAWETARRCGWKIPIELQPYESLAEERRDLIADNRLAQDAITDEQKLAQLLSEMDGEDVALTGYDQNEIDSLLSQLGQNDVDAEPQIDKAAELAEKWKIKRGQIWQLGNHRLMCGDSSESKEVQSLINGGEIAMTFTDPPYNVNYGANPNPRHKIRSIKNDDLGRDFPAFIKKCLEGILQATKGAIYICMSDKEWARMFTILESLGAHWSSTIVWCKDRLVLSPKDYHRRHELIWYGWSKRGNRLPLKDRTKTDVWEIARPSRSDEHPTMKPVALVSEAVRNSSKAGAPVYEPFSGSGTTIIACEQLGRKCRAMEIDPGYVAVAIQRWAAATGRKPKLVGSM